MWLMLPAVILVGIYGGLYQNSGAYRGYWTSVVSNSSLFLVITCTFATLTAALEGGNERRGRLLSAVSARAPAHILAVRIWPSIAAAFVVQLLGVFSLAGQTWGAPGRIPWEIFLVFLSIIFLHASFGYALGRCLPRTAAIALSMVISYGWLGFSWAASYFPPRFLAGPALSSCCSTAQQLTPLALWLPPLFSVPLGLMILRMTTAKGRPAPIRSPEGEFKTVGRRLRLSGRMLGRLAGFVVLGSALSAGCLYLARDVGPDTSEPRPESQLQCVGSRPEICLFPEELAFESTLGHLQHSFRRLAQVGLPIPERVTTLIPEENPGTGSAPVPATSVKNGIHYIVAAPGMSQTELADTVAASYFGAGVSAGHCQDSPQIISLSIYEQLVIDWLSVKAQYGSNMAAQHAFAEKYVDQAGPELSPAIQRNIEAFRQGTAQEQKFWVNKTFAALAQCRKPPRFSSPTLTRE